MKRKKLTFILSALLILNPMISVYAEDSINSLQKDVDEANQNIDSNNNEIEDQTKKIESLTSEIEELNSEYEEIRTSFNQNQEKIDQLTDEIDAKTQRISDLEEEYKQRKELAKPLLVMLQKNNNINFFVEILYSDNVSTVDKISTLNSLNVLSDNAVQKLVKTVEVKEDVKQEKTTLVADKETLDSKQADLKAQGETLLKKSNEQERKKQEALKIVTSLKSENSSAKTDLLEKTGLIADYKLAGCSGTDVYGVDCGLPPEEPETVEETISSYEEPKSDDNKSEDKKDTPVNNTGGSYVAKLKADPNANYIINRESGWNPSAVNPSSGAYGLCQALPGTKMASAGSDWRTNIETQAKWCDSYVSGRYGSWAGARAFWDANHWF